MCNKRFEECENYINQIKDQRDTLMVENSHFFSDHFMRDASSSFRENIFNNLQSFNLIKSTNLRHIP
jgi:hypothetical protein